MLGSHPIERDNVATKGGADSSSKKPKIQRPAAITAITKFKYANTDSGSWHGGTIKKRSTTSPS